MSSVAELLNKLFSLVNENEDRNHKLKFQKAQQNPIEQLKVIIDAQLMKSQEYKDLERQLQKYENEIRNHIRDYNLMQIKNDELHARLEEFESVRDELLQNTKTMINKYKRENEELYSKVKTLTTELQDQKQLNCQILQYQEKIKILESLTQQSSKISNSKFSTIDNVSNFGMKKPKNEHLKTHSNATPLKNRQQKSSSFQNESLQFLTVNVPTNNTSSKRLSQQYLQPFYQNTKILKQMDKSKYIKNKRKSVAINSQSLQQQINFRELSSSM